VIEQSSLRARGFSIGTKLILITVLIETSTVVAGMMLAYAFLSETRITEFQQLLFSQSDLIAKEVELEKEHPEMISKRVAHLELGQTGTYQLVDSDGVVSWDSRDPKRAGSQIVGQHMLFNIARKSALKRGTTDYTIPQTQERFLGAYRRIADRYYILGAISKDEIDLNIDRTLERFFYLALLLYGMSFFAIVLFTRKIITPVQSLTSAAMQIAQGNFDIELEKPSWDEIGLLSETFTAMTQRIRILIEGEEQKIRIEQEVGNVAELQQLLLPPPMVKTDRYEIASFYQSATETGGDYWGFIETENHLIVYVGDATGHGLPSAMMTAAARGCFSSLQLIYRADPTTTPTLEKFLAHANQAVLDVSQGQLQMTLFVAMISFRDNTITYANAGHQAAYVLKSGPNAKLQTLLGKGMRLGETQNFKVEAAKTIPWEKTDILFLYSDGLTDLSDADGAPFGRSRLKKELQKLSTQSLTLSQMREKIRKITRDHSPNILPDDDITFAFVRLQS
jgi:serine phosphatase RsbU (regulator of sigma subunit)